MDQRSLCILLCVMYFCTGCKDSSKLYNNNSSYETNSKNSEQLHPSDANFEANKRLGKLNYYKFKSELTKSISQIDREMDQELLEKNKIDRMNAIEDEENRRNQLQTITRNEVKAKAYYDRE